MKRWYTSCSCCICIGAGYSLLLRVHPRLFLPKDPDTTSDITVNSVTFADAASSVPYAHIEPQHYSEYDLPVVTRKTYQCVPQEDVCYMLSDMCRNLWSECYAAYHSSDFWRTRTYRVTVPVGLALNVGSGKTYYIEMSADANGKVAATWATRVAPKTLKLATQNMG